VCITRVMGVSKAAVLAEEFATFVDLELSLHMGAEELLPHFHRILLSLGLPAPRPSWLPLPRRSC
jgi:hypothetical protein